MPLVPDQGPVQQLAAAGLHPALHEGVHTRHADPAEHDLDSRVFEEGVEQFGELPIPVPDQELCLAAGILEVHDEVLRRLCDPGRGRVCGGAEEPDPPVGMLNHCEYVQPGSGHGDRFEEVACEKCIGLGA